MAKYHGAADRGGRITRKPNPTRVKKKPIELEDAMFELTVMKKSNNVKKKRTIVPKYKDPMASTKLDMIKKIKAQRTEMDVRKREAIDKAKYSCEYNLPDLIATNKLIKSNDLISKFKIFFM